MADQDDIVIVAIICLALVSVILVPSILVYDENISHSEFETCAEECGWVNNDERLECLLSCHEHFSCGETEETMEDDLSGQEKNS